MSTKRCYLCGGNNVKPIYKIFNRKVFCCFNDGLFFSSDNKSEELYYGRKYYDSSPYNQRQLFNNPYFQNKLNKIVSLTGDSKPNILDVGCGWGNFLQVVKNNNLPYFGIDLSSRAIEICQEKKLNCQKMDLIQFSKISNQKYSIITLFQVIEHLKKPFDYLKAAKKLLKKNGVILITTPNNQSPFRYLLGSNWPVYQTPSHYFFYSKKSFERLLILSGFSKFKIRIDGFRFFSSDYILQRVFKRKVSIPRVINFPVPTDPWGDLEAVIINK